MNGPFETDVVAHLGPVPLTRSLITSAAITLFLVLAGLLATRRMRLRPGRFEALVEMVVSTIERQIEEVMRRDPRPFTPLLGSLFLYLLVANLCSAIPRVQSPTAKLEVPAALTAIVFAAVRYYGVRMSGLKGHLKSYAQPNLFALPLNLIGEITRTFALMIRLFGNMMSGQFMVAVVIALAGLFVPVPLMVLGLVIGAIQAYIFTVLAAAFISAGITTLEAEEKAS